MEGEVVVLQLARWPTTMIELSHDAKWPLAWFFQYEARAVSARAA